MTKTRILVVEDEVVVAEEIRNCLLALGYAVPAVIISGEEAIEKAEELRPTLVLMDIRLVGPVDGVEAAQQIQSRFGIPVVYLTAYADEATVQRAKITEPFGYILKPFTPQALRSTIEIALYRHETDRKLQESEERMRRLIETMAEGVVLISADGQITQANPAAEQILGLEQSEIEAGGYASPEWERIRPDGTPMPPEEMAGPRAMRETRLVKDVEMGVKRPDGSISWVNASAAPLVNEEGILEGIVGTFADISERRRVEEQLRQQERLATVGQLAAGIAHDFNNILTSITLYADILRRKPHLPADALPGVTSIAGAARQAADLVQQILDFGRRSILRKQRVDLGAVVSDVSGILRRTIPETIRIQFDEDQRAFEVDADPARIQQALVNLATNARDAMPEGGTLHIDLSRLRLLPGAEPPVAGMANGEWICLTVSDTGTGIPQQMLPHIFEPFFTTKEVGKGSGLGLSQVYGIVMQHEGQISVQTELGHGTSFRIYLPPYRATWEQDPQPAEQQPVPEAKGETILLVEDLEQLREALKQALESAGYNVLSVANGRDALDVCGSVEKIDMVIADLVMPEIGGRLLVSELRKQDPQLPALIITGYDLEENTEVWSQEGITDVIRKPFDVDTLLNTIRRALEQG